MAIAAFARRVFGSANDRRVKRYQPAVMAINALEAELEKLSDDQLRPRTAASRHQAENGANVDAIPAPPFATVRQAS